MSVLYVTEQGAMVRRESRHLLVSKDHVKLAEIPALEVDQIVVFGRVEVTVPVIDLLLQTGKELVYLTTKGEYKGRLQGSLKSSVNLRAAQFAAWQSEATALILSKAFVGGKLANAKTILLRLNRYHVKPDVDGLSADISRYQKQAKLAGNIETLRGLEGLSAKTYFSGWRTFLKPTFTWEKRVRRPPKDPVNVMLSLGYTLLANSVAGALNVVGLDSAAGFYHTERAGRPSLALDLMEEFRPAIVDSLVMTLINKEIIRPDHFTISGSNCLLSRAGLKRFLSQYEQRLADKIIYPATGDRVSLFRVIELQARALAGFLADSTRAYKAFRIR